MRESYYGNGSKMKEMITHTLYKADSKAGQWTEKPKFVKFD